MTYTLKPGASNRSRITLKRPVQHDGRELRDIPFRPTKKDLEDFGAALAAGTPAITLLPAFLSRATGLPLSVVKQIRQSDLDDIEIVLNSGGPPAAQRGRHGH